MANELPKCDADVYSRGELVFITHTIRARQIEEWVIAVREKSGQHIDWHYAGGRACVLALGDLQRVRDAITELMSEHDRLFRAECALFDLGVKVNPPRPHWWAGAQ